MSSTEEMTKFRLANFAVRAEPTREPDFEGEKTVFVTYSGQQEYPTQLAPHEARKLYDLLAVEFGFGEQQVPDTSRDDDIAIAEAARSLSHRFFNGGIKTSFDICALWDLVKTLDDDRALKSTAPKMAGNGEGE